MRCLTIACMMPPVRTPCSTAWAMDPALRIWLMARMWCSWPCSTPRPCCRSTPSEVPNNAASMSWVASAFPANRMSTKPASTRATIAGAAPVWTTAGPPTQRILRPSSLMSRICWAIWRTSSACGFSEETSEFMNSKPPALRSIAGSGTTFTPLAPHTSWSPVRTSLTGDRPRPVALDDDPAVHLGVLDRHPRAAEPDDRLQVGRGVEVVGEDAVGLDLARCAPRRGR